MTQRPYDVILYGASGFVGKQTVAYFAKHPELPYCEINIRPKIGKFEKAFKSNSKLQKAKEAKKKKS